MASGTSPIPVPPVPVPPTPGGIPSPVPPGNINDFFVPFVEDAIWDALGAPKPTRIYVSTQGDWWDLIAIKVYGAVRGNEHLMYRLLESNQPLVEIAEFPPGVAVIVPAVDTVTEIALVPWKNAALLPQTNAPGPF
jgi:hypothetical protein